eukprot:16716-Heterococcus_DN1.PRE.3
MTTLTGDLLHLVLGFCTQDDLCRLRQTSRYLQVVGQDDTLWEGLLLQRADFAVDTDIPRALQTLGLQTCKQLAEALHKMPCGLGYWRAEATACERFGGELLCITAIPEGLLCRSVFGDGTTRDLFCARVRARAAPAEGVSVVFFSLEHSLSPKKLGVQPRGHGAHKIGLSRSATGFTLVRSGSTRQFVRVEQPQPATAAAAAFAPVAGLFSAFYGSHTEEVLEAVVDTDATGLVLRGTKVIGDQHVPAGCCSFLVSLSRSFAPAQQLQGTPDLVVVFSADGASVVELAQRAPSVVSWHKGRGQTNLRADQWAPAWVDVDLLMYGPEAQCAFSVIWHEPAQGVGVMVDFSRLPACEGVQRATWTL